MIYTKLGTIGAGLGCKFTGESSGVDWEVDIASNERVHCIPLGQISPSIMADATILGREPRYVFIEDTVAAGDELIAGSNGFFKKYAGTGTPQLLVLKSGVAGNTCLAFPY